MEAKDRNSSQSTQESLFLSDTSVWLDGKPECMAILATHGMSDELVPEQRIDYCILELVFEGERLVCATDWLFGEAKEHELLDGALNIRPVNIPKRPLYRLVLSSQDHDSHFGGRQPEVFSLPQTEYLAPFQFIGTLTTELEGLEWLPFKLHITLPTLNNYGTLYLDYKDPDSPVFMDTSDSELSDFNWKDDVMTTKTVRELRLTLRRQNLISKRTDAWDFGKGSEGHLGIPNWVQFPDIPLCPHSGKTMKFVCEFGFNTAVTDLVDSLPLSNEEMSLHLQKHWQDMMYAVVYLFLEPESRILCVKIQST